MPACILVVRRFSSAQMAFGLVDIQYLSDASVQPWIYRFQPIGYILMDRTLSDTKRLCRFTYGCFVLHNVCCFLADAVFIPIQGNTPICLLLKHMRVLCFYVRKIRC